MARCPLNIYPVEDKPVFERKAPIHLLFVFGAVDDGSMMENVDPHRAKGQCGTGPNKRVCAT